MLGLRRKELIATATAIGVQVSSLIRSADLTSVVGVASALYLTWIIISKSMVVRALSLGIIRLSILYRAQSQSEDGNEQRSATKKTRD